MSAAEVAQVYRITAELARIRMGTLYIAGGAGTDGAFSRWLASAFMLSMIFFIGAAAYRLAVSF